MHLCAHRGVCRVVGDGYRVTVTEESTNDDGSQNTSASDQNPIELILRMLSVVDPLEVARGAVDTSRRSVEAMLSVLENLAGTLDNLNRTTARVNDLLDDIEEPLRRVMPQLGVALGAMATLGDAATQLADLGKRLGPLTTLAENAGGLFGLKPQKSPPATSEASGQV